MGRKERGKHYGQIHPFCSRRYTSSNKRGAFLRQADFYARSARMSPLIIDTGVAEKVIWSFNFKKDHIWLPIIGCVAPQ